MGTLYDLIEEVKRSRNKVIPTSYILERLRLIESDNKDCMVQIPTYTMESFPRVSQDVMKGGD